MTETDNRALARRHTAQLLKMLRGYEPTPESAPAAAIPPVAVAEAPASYTRTPTPTSSRPSAGPPGAPSFNPQHAAPRPSPAAVPTVGERLRRPQQGTLGQLLAQADRLNQLTQIFRAYLPPLLQDHATLIRLDAESWLVHADSSSWATRLRYALHDIRQVLGQHLGLTLPKPRIQVVPVARPQPPQRPRLTLTERDAKILENAARAIPDPRLSAALLRLSKRGRPPRKDPT